MGISPRTCTSRWDTEPDPADKRRPAQIKNRDKVLDAFAEIQTRNEIFIQHHIAKGEPVPFWAAIEVVSIGTFSRFLRALRDKSVLDPTAPGYWKAQQYEILTPSSEVLRRPVLPWAGP